MIAPLPTPISEPVRGFVYCVLHTIASTVYHDRTMSRLARRRGTPNDQSAPSSARDHVAAAVSGTPLANLDVLGNAGAPASYVRVRGLDKVYPTVRNLGVVALKDVNFDLYEGEFLSVLGPSGCGKSTLLKAIAGLAPI